LGAGDFAAPIGLLEILQRRVGDSVNVAGTRDSLARPGLPYRNNCLATISR
jgi:hypothetical protein